MKNISFESTIRGPAILFGIFAGGCRAVNDKTLTMFANKFILSILIISLVTFAMDVFAIAGDTESIEKSLALRDDVVFFGGFEEGYNDNSWKSRWGIPWLNRAADNVVVTNGFHGGKSLRVKYPEGGVGPIETGGQFPMVFRDMEGISEGLYQELYMCYYLKFEGDFDFNQGGKLPGLMGGGDSWGRSGGNQPDGTNGWTLRFMWRSEGKLVIYAYVPKSENGKWGNDRWGQDIECDFKAEPDKWHCVEQYVNVGTPGKANGKLVVWIDGVERLNINDMRFWNVENDNGLVGGIFFSTFHGGGSTDWAPRRDSYAQFDRFVAAKKRVGVFINQ
jgi:hypothetical protein